MNDQLLSDMDVSGTQIGANFAKNSLEKVSSRSEVYRYCDCILNENRPL